MTTLVEGLATFAASLRTADDLPDLVRQSIADRVLDIAGIQIAALRLDTSRACLDHVLEQGGTEQALVAGCAQPLPAASAAFAGGVLAHSLDYDDTHLPSILHPSASVVPSALASAQAFNASGTQMIAAIAAGLEICVRLGMAGYDAESRNSLYFERGQHATSICGAIASAATAAMLAGLDSGGIAHAMSIAVSLGSGVIEANRSGGTVKRLHCGFAAQAGVNAALLARRGLTGPPTALEGRFGFFHAWLDGRFDAAPLRDGLGTHWEIPRIFFKPYPANHFTHTGIDAMIELRREGLRPEDVERITLGVAAPTVRTIGEPIQNKRAPETGYQAQFSGPYTIVAALLGGGGLGLGLDDFTDALANDPQRRALMQKVDVVADPISDAIYPSQFPCILTVQTVDGRALQRRVDANRGGPERPLSAEELKVKFQDNALRVIDASAVATIVDAVARLDSLKDVGDIVRPAAFDSQEVPQ